MIKINAEQTNWLKENFALSKKDFPKDFYEPKEIIDYLLGLSNFRGFEHQNSQSDLLSFIEASYLSMTSRETNKVGFIRIFIQFEYLITVLEEKEYYELLSNFTTMMSCFLRAVEITNDIDFSYKLFELGFKKTDAGFVI